MASEPAYLLALKAYSKSRYGTADDVKSILDDFTNESDRGAVMLAATGVEDMLEYEILKRLPVLQTDNAARKQMFEQDGPISSFSLKIKMAYALGIIDKDYRKRIDLIREIRNACAHCRKPISLAVPEFQAVVKVVIADMLPGLINQEPSTLRSAFVITTSFVSHYIVTGEKVEGEEAQTAFWERLQTQEGS